MQAFSSNYVALFVLLTINLFPMSYRNYLNIFFRLLNDIKYSIVSDSYSPTVTPMEFFGMPGEWFFF